MGRTRKRRTDAEKAAPREAVVRGPTLLQRIVSVRRIVQFSVGAGVWFLVSSDRVSRCLQCVGACPTGALSLGLVRLGGDRQG